MNQVILFTFVLAITFIPYSHGQCQISDTTITDEKGVELGACKNPDTSGKLFTYVSNSNSACCEARTGRFRTLCINYKFCNDGFGSSGGEGSGGSGGDNGKGNGNGGGAIKTTGKGDGKGNGEGNGNGGSTTNCNGSSGIGGRAGCDDGRGNGKGNGKGNGGGTIKTDQRSPFGG